MKKWEYKIEFSDMPTSELNKLGRDGWELVCRNKTIMHFKRELQGE